MKSTTSQSHPVSRRNHGRFREGKELGEESGRWGGKCRITGWMRQVPPGKWGGEGFVRRGKEESKCWETGKET